MEVRSLVERVYSPESTPTRTFAHGKNGKKIKTKNLLDVKTSSSDASSGDEWSQEKKNTQKKKTTKHNVKKNQNIVHSQTVTTTTETVMLSPSKKILETTTSSTVKTIQHIVPDKNIDLESLLREKEERTKMLETQLRKEQQEKEELMRLIEQQRNARVGEIQTNEEEPIAATIVRQRKKRTQQRPRKSIVAYEEAAATAVSVQEEVEKDPSPTNRRTIGKKRTRLDAFMTEAPQPEVEEENGNEQIAPTVEEEKSPSKPAKKKRTRISSDGTAPIIIEQEPLYSTAEEADDEPKQTTPIRKRIKSPRKIRHRLPGVSTPSPTDEQENNTIVNADVTKQDEVSPSKRVLPERRRERFSPSKEEVRTPSPIKLVSPKSSPVKESPAKPGDNSSPMKISPAKQENATVNENGEIVRYRKRPARISDTTLELASPTKQPEAGVETFRQPSPRNAQPPSPKVGQAEQPPKYVQQPPSPKPVEKAPPSPVKQPQSPKKVATAPKQPSPVKQAKPKEPSPIEKQVAPVASQKALPTQTQKQKSPPVSAPRPAVSPKTPVTQTTRQYSLVRPPAPIVGAQRATWSEKLAAARQALSRDGLTGMEYSLEGREVETKQLETILTECISKEKGTSIYISGQPGTGKTTTVRQLVDRCNINRVLYLNCMSYKTAQAFYEAFLSGLSKKLETSGYESGDEEKAKNTTDKIIRTIDRSLTKPFILMLDEAESLQKVVREQFIKWAKNTPLILIGITNALVGDAVHGFQHSIPFATYKKAAIMQIIKERLRAACGDDIIFSEFALSIIGSKCESEGGVRIALDLAKKCLEVTDEEPPGGKGIGIGTVNKQHLQYFTTNSALEEIKKLPLQQKLVLCAAWLYKENNKSLSITVNHVLGYYKSLMDQHNLEKIESSQVLTHLQSLNGQNFIKLEHKGKNKQQNVVALDSVVIVQATKNDLEYALKDEETSLIRNILEAKFKAPKTDTML